MNVRDVRSRRIQVSPISKTRDSIDDEVIAESMYRLRFDEQLGRRSIHIACTPKEATCPPNIQPALVASELAFSRAAVPHSPCQKPALFEVPGVIGFPSEAP